MYYRISVEPTMLVSLRYIAFQQSKATKKTYEETLWPRNYAASHPDAMICYRARNMVLHIHSEASYLLEPQARSSSGGHYFLSEWSLNPLLPP